MSFNKTNMKSWLGRIRLLVELLGLISLSGAAWKGLINL